MDFSFYLLIFILGIVTGSFLNVCLCRIPTGDSVIAPPSRCPACFTRLAVIDLVPLASFVFLKGRCRYCNTVISPRYPAVELLTGVLFAAVVWKYGVSVDSLSFMVLFSIFVAVTFIDISYRIIPDKIMLWGALPGIIINFHSMQEAYDGLLGFLAGGSILLLVAVISRGGMGGGDIKLAAVAGIYLGWKMVLLMLFTGFLLGALWGIGLIVIRKKTFKEAVPFGPFLAAGGVIAVLFGDAILGWYLSFFMVL